MRKQDKIIVWSAYFDSTRTRKDGRRVSRSLAVPTPRITEVKDAADRLHMDAELIPDVAYPKTSSQKAGMLQVKKKQSKEKTIKEIAVQLMRIRSSPVAKQGN
jgi:signal recognition particle subunit SRP19